MTRHGFYSKLTFLVCVALSPPLARAQTPTPTCVSYLDNYSADTLGNYDITDQNWNASTATVQHYQISGGELQVAPPSAVGYSYAIVDTTSFSKTLGDYTVEADFKLDTGPGVIGVVGRATPASYQAYMFQWNGLNNRWEIEKQIGVGTYDYVATLSPGATLPMGGAAPAFTYGTWVHLKLVMGPGNLFNAWMTPSSGPPVLIFSNVTDTYSPPAPYLTGEAGLRAYNVPAGTVLHIANFAAYTCALTGTDTVTPTYTQPPAFTYTVTNTPTFSKTPTPTPTWTSTWSPTESRTFTSSPTPTYTRTPSFTYTITNTPTASFTRTPTKTPTESFTPTDTHTPTATKSPTPTRTITNTPTITNSPTITDTPGPTTDIFYVSKNLFTSSGPVSIHVEYSNYPGPYSLKVYNTAGELVKTIVPAKTADNYISLSTTWDGTNDHGEACASGVYILYLIEPFNVKLKKVILIHQ